MRASLRYWYRDGVEQLLGGIDMVFMGGALYALLLGLRGAVSDWVPLAAILASLAFLIARDRVQERIRQRVTYPRIGYLSTERGEPLSGRRRLLILVAALAVPLIILTNVAIVMLVTGRLTDLATWALWARWVPALFGVIGGAAMWWDSARGGIVRLRVEGVLLIGVGIAISLTVRNPLEGIALLLAAWGLLSAVTGAIALWRFASAPADSASA